MSVRPVPRSVLHVRCRACQRGDYAAAPRAPAASAAAHRLAARPRPAPARFDLAPQLAAFQVARPGWRGRRA
jgi:hypothetical protein